MRKEDRQTLDTINFMHNENMKEIRKRVSRLFVVDNKSLLEKQPKNLHFEVNQSIIGPLGRVLQKGIELYCFPLHLKEKELTQFPVLASFNAFCLQINLEVNAPVDVAKPQYIFSFEAENGETYSLDKNYIDSAYDVCLALVEIAHKTKD